jgi:ubiquinone/menaquinone biosynthesis C-methylase UbiE
MGKIMSWIDSHNERERHCTGSRSPFYDTARKYLPSGNDEVIVDIGAGEGDFFAAMQGSLPGNSYLLDANPETVAQLKRSFPGALLYKAPERLPFHDAAVSFIHCSHLIEHFSPGELYRFLAEVDRVLKDGGILVISTPLQWENFYGDLSHVRPYSHTVFINYLCQPAGPRSAGVISNNYSPLELSFRYTNSATEQWGSSNILLDFSIIVLRRLLTLVGIKKYAKNGYTLVLEKRLD